MTLDLGRMRAWRRYLSLEDAQSQVLTELRHYARVAWTFLNTAGHINFGVAPAIARRALGAPQERGSVIVVGAGLAGGAHTPSEGLLNKVSGFESGFWGVFQGSCGCKAQREQKFWLVGLFC